MQPKLLVTRFAPHAQQLAEQLTFAGVQAYAQPLLEVRPLSDPERLQALISGSYDIVIAVSGNAVKYTDALDEFSWPESHYLAVGESTQSALQQATKQAVQVPSLSTDSEGLLALPVLQAVADKRVLILRGKGGRDLLHKKLQARGAQVDFLESYQRVNIELDGFKCVNSWQQASINSAIISSVEILNQLVKLIPAEHQSWLLGLSVYVPSERVRQRACHLGFKQVYLLPSLKTEQIVSFFKELKVNY